MSDIEFTRDELANELLAMQGEIAAGSIDSDLVSLVAFTISQFDETVSSEVSEGIIDETQAIEFEDFRSGIAEAIHQAAKERMGNTPHVNILSHYKDRPRADAKRKAEKEAQDAERKASADHVLEEITAVEAEYAVTSHMLRQNTYKDPTMKPQEQNGTWLAHKIEEVEDNGSGMAVFTAHEAKILAGNSLTKKSHADILQLKQDLGKLAKLHEQAKSFGARVESGLFSAVNKLRELAETAVLEKRSDLKEVHRFIELLEAPTEDLFERIVTELDEGPFADCPELDVLPFPPSSEQRGKSSLKEIPSDDATEENILDDIKKAKKASGDLDVIEKERVSEFVSLKKYLEHKYPGQIKIYRSLKSNWHPLPWYVIEIAQPNNAPMAVLESPLYGNATYYINNGDWRDTINYKRTDAQQLGAKPIIHSVAEGQKLDMHTNRIKAVIDKSYRG